MKLRIKMLALICGYIMFGSLDHLTFKMREKMSSDEGTNSFICS